jgi:hypothetical protein
MPRKSKKISSPYFDDHNEYTYTLPKWDLGYPPCIEGPEWRLGKRYNQESFPDESIVRNDLQKCETCTQKERGEKREDPFKLKEN